jgi:hypothetical protein
MRLQALLLCIAFLACSSGSAGHASDAGGDVEGADGADGSSGSGGGSGSGGSSGGSGSGSSSGIPLTDASEPPCNLTVQGAVTGAFPCTASLQYFTSANRSTFAIAVGDPRPLQLVSVTIQHVGHPMSGTWASTDTGASGGATVEGVESDAGFPTWQVSAASSGGQDGGGAQGKYDLQLTVGVGKPTPTGESFGSTGTLSATLPAVTQSGATGTVTLHVAF